MDQSAASSAPASAPSPWAPAATPQATAPPQSTAQAAAYLAGLFALNAGAASLSASGAGAGAPPSIFPSPPSFPCWWSSCADSAPWRALPPTGVPVADEPATLSALSAVLGAPVGSLTSSGGATDAIPVPLSGGVLSERALASALRTRLAPRRLGKGEEEVAVVAAAHSRACAAPPSLAPLCRLVLARHLADKLAGDSGEDLYFEGGRVRTAFTAALAGGRVSPSLLDDVLSLTADAKAAAMWEGMLRAALGAVRGAPLDDLGEVEARLRPLDRLSACAPLARALASMLHAEAAAACAAHASGRLGAASFEARSVLQPLLTYSALSSSPGPTGAPSKDGAAAFARLPKYPETPRGDRERVVALVGACVARAAAALHALLERVLKQRGACMEAGLAWLAAAACAGAARTQAGGVHGTRAMSAAAKTATSDAWALGVTQLCLRFCRPFLDGAPAQLARLDGAEGLARRWRVDRSREDPLLVGAVASQLRAQWAQGAEAASWRPFFAPAGATPALHFVNECFQLALLSLHTGLGPAVEAFERARYHASRSAGAAGGEALAADARFNALCDCGVAALLDPAIAGEACRFSLLAYAWLLRTSCAGEVQQQQRAFACIPGSAVRDLSTFLTFLLNFGRADLLSGAASMHVPVAAAVEAAASLLQRRDLVASPLVLGATVDLLHAMLSADRHLQRGSGPQGRTGSAAHDALVGAVLANPAARKSLCPALITAYASLDAVEGLDVDRDDFDKFNTRSKIAKLLAELWEMPECVASVAAMAGTPSEEAASLGPFSAFAQAALLDLMYLLEDALARLVDIRDVQTAQADEAAWAALPERQRADKLRFLEGQENAARGFMLQARRTLQLLNMLSGTPSVAQAFLGAPVAGGAAYATVHFLELLLGPRCEGLRVSTPEKYHFDPRALLLGIVEFTLRLDAACEPGSPAFARAVAAEDDYSREVLEKAGGVMSKRGVGDASHSARLRAFIDKCEAARDPQRSTAVAAAAAAAAVAGPSAPAAAVDPAWGGEYVRALAPLLYRDVPPGGLGGYFRQFEELAARPEGQQKAKSRRLAKELAAFAAPGGLSLDPGSAICVRTDEERMDKLRAMLTGPQGTPYALGCFVFDVYFPADYPLKAPLVNFDTTGGGRVRANPNLYADGKVCLSLLGTWHGGHASEKWDPGASSLNQVLLSIQAMILVDEPWYNEPGAEGMRGTPEGLRRSSAYNEELQLYTVRHAMLAQLRKPRAGLEDAIVAHFTAAAPAVRAQVAAWLAATQDETLKGRMAEAATELYAELDKLKPPPA